MKMRKLDQRQRVMFAVAISTVSGFNLKSFASNDVWSPTAVSGSWSLPANWSSLPVTGDSLEFGSTSGPLALTDNLMTPSNYSISAITFDAGAPAYIISPASASTNGFSLTGSIADNSTTTETLNDPVSLTAADTFTVASAGTLVLGGSISGTGSITTAGAGSLTLSGTDSYSGGVTLGSGQLNIDSATALGSAASVFTINGGTIDNNSSSAKTLTTNNAVAINGDFTFNGTQNLSLGTGAVTLGGTGSTRTINVSAGTLTLGYLPTATGYGLTKTGAGTLAFGSNTSNLTGPVNVLGGTVAIGANDMHAGGLTGTGTLQDGSSSTRWYFINSTSAETFSGTLQDGGTGQLGFNFTGTSAASLTLSGNNTLSNLFTVAGGTVSLTGSYIPSAGSASDDMAVWTNANYNAAVTNANPTLNISGTVKINSTVDPSIQIGAGSATTGVVNVTTGGTLTAASEIWLSTGDGGYGLLNETGGQVTVNNWLALGRGGGTGIVSVTGGSLTINNAPVTVGSTGGSSSLLHGVFTVGGTGTVIANNNFYVGEQAMAVVTVMGSGSLSSPINGVTIGVDAGGANSTLNLDGGTLNTASLTQGAGTGGSLNFNGGALKAAAASQTFLSGISNAYIYGGGATIDDGGHAITVSENLQAPTGSGVTATGVTVSGSGFTGAPAVQITGGGGTGATAIATIDGSGNLLGITITNPGVGYTSAPSFTLLGGGLANTGAVGGTASLVSNISGSLTKIGIGVTTLTGSSSYTGATIINAGTLALSGSGSINGTSAISVNNGAKLLQISSTPITQPVSVVSGTLDGTGSLSSAVISSSLSNVLTSGNGSIGQLTIGSLTFSGAATTSFITDLAANTSAGIIATSLATGSTAGAIKVNLIDTDTSVANGTYELLAYNSVTGAGFNAFSLGTVSGLSGRQTAVLKNVISGSTDYVAITISGVAGSLVWTGATNSNWTTSTSAKNWTLNSTSTSFVTGDNVLFDDSTSNTTVSITDATVTPSGVTFNNNSNSYTIGGTGAIAGGTAVTLNGGASVTINNGNTYTGGTAVNAGTLNINNASAIGTGTLTINGGSIGSTAASPVTLSTNNAQVWDTSFAFTGSQSLNLGTGNVTLNSSVAVTTNGTTLTVGGAITGGAVNLSKEGTGTLALTGSVAISGNTFADAGTLSLNALTSPGNMYVSTSGAAAAVTTSGAVNQANFYLGNSSGGTAALYVTGGTLTQTGGGSVNSFNVGNTTGAYGYINVAAGATVVAGEQDIASINGGDGLVEVNGGSVNNNGWVTMTRNQTVAPQYAAFNVYSGNYNYAGGGVVANWGGQQSAVINVLGGSLTTTNSSVINLNLSGNPTNVGILNINGGVVQPSGITGTGGVVNFNGGTLRAAATNTTFINVGSTYIYSGGATIDTNGNNIMLTQPLQAPTGGGVTAPTISNGGAGYVAPPLVTVTPGSGDTTGTGATAVATINRTTGQLTGITITSPGIGYTAPPVFNLVDSGGATSSASITSNTPVANVGGGLTKAGAGTLTLASTNTYSGSTIISGGTLQIGALSQTALVASYSFDNTTATPVGVPGTIVNSGTGGSALNGVTVQSSSNTTNAVQIGSGGPNINGNGGAGNSLSFDGSGGTVNISSGITNLDATGHWTFSTWVETGESGATLFSKNTNGGWAAGNSVFYFTNGADGGGTEPGAVRNSGLFLTGATPTTDGNWHMVTYVDNGGTKSIYVDGVASPLAQTGVTNADVGNIVQLGLSSDTYAGDGAQSMTGNLDDIDFFSGALTTAQVQALYTTNNAGLSPTIPNVLPAATAVQMTNSGTVLDVNGNLLTVGSLTGVSGSIVALGGGTLTVGNATSTTFAGTIQDAGSASASTGGSLIKQGSGTLTLSSTNSYSGGTTVNAGLLIAGAGTASLGSGLVDVNAGGIIFRGTTAASIFSMLHAGYNAGGWNGTAGIDSTSAANDPAHLHAVGMLQPTTATTFEGQSLGTGDVAVKYTYYGDANLDGKVDGSDYSLIDYAYAYNQSHSSAPLTGWQDGDFNYDGVVNGSDYTLIDNAYNQQGARISADIATPTALIGGVSSAVPEPVSLGVIAMGAAGLLGRRAPRRRAR